MEGHRRPAILCIEKHCNQGFNSHNSACVTMLRLAHMIGSVQNGFDLEIQPALFYAFSSEITQIRASRHQDFCIWL